MHFIESVKRSLCCDRSLSNQNKNVRACCNTKQTAIIGYEVYIVLSAFVYSACVLTALRAVLWINCLFRFPFKCDAWQTLGTVSGNIFYNKDKKEFKTTL